jgi:hypothetical protein
LPPESDEDSFSSEEVYESSDEDLEEDSDTGILI